MDSKMNRMTQVTFFWIQKVKIILL